MPELIRTFIAVPVEPPAEIRAVMKSIRAIGGPIRMIDFDQMHLTLNFLGETRWNQVSEIGESIDQVVKQFTCFEVTLDSLGAFPDARRPRVVWAGLSLTERVTQLAETLAVELERLSFPREDRRYKPHLTLARVKGRCPAELQKIITDQASKSFGTIHVEEVILYQSELAKSGPIYTALSTHSLQEG